MSPDAAVLAPRDASGVAGSSPATALRVGVDVGGTFTKAVAMRGASSQLIARSVTPTSHAAAAGVSAGVATVLSDLLGQLGPERDEVELVAYSTTIAMNALLEGDVPRVGVIGIGGGSDARLARKRTSVGDIALAQGKRLHTEHLFLDAAALTPAAIDGALDRLQSAGCASIAVSAAFSVDDAEAECLVAARARERGLPACAGHELTGTYGLETRTVSAAINASILPLVKETAAIVEDSVQAAGIDVPLLVLKGDGGSMTLDAFRRAPSFTIGSGPAAGVAAALHELGLQDGLIVECGGTSSNVSIVKRGRAVQRTLRVMERPTSIRTVDSWVVGAAGGSMARVSRRKLRETGPRSAHVAGLQYACFADPEDLAGAEAQLLAPCDGDPDTYIVLRDGANAWALTATCAASALGLGSDGAAEAAALVAFERVAPRLRSTPEQAARALLDGAVDKIAAAIKDAAKAHDFDLDVPLVALGGAGPLLVPEVARRLGRPLLTPANPEVLSSVGAALSLIRTEVVRTATGGDERLHVTRDAQRACVEAGAAPHTVTVETLYEHDAGLIRAVATGAVALQSGAAGRPRACDGSARDAAARALELDAADIELVIETDFYRVFSGNGKGGCAVVDEIGTVPLAERSRCILHGDADAVVEQLRPAVTAESVNLGLAELAPRVVLVCGPSIIDLSDARSAEDILDAANGVLGGHEGDAVAVIWS